MINQQTSFLMKSLLLGLNNRCETAAFLKTLLCIGLFTSSLLILTHSAQAELSLRHDRLSVNVQEASLKVVLNVLSQQGGIRVTVLDELSFADATISARFDQIPIVEALDRLLVQWNFGMTKDRGTGRIQEIFLASKRKRPEELPARPQPIAPQPYSEESPDQSDFGEELAHFSSDSEFGGERESGNTDESDIGDVLIDGEDFTEDMIPEDLPPEIREVLLQDMAASREGR